MASLVHNWDIGDVVFSISVSPDGSLIAAGRRSHVMILNANNGDVVLGPILGHTGWVWSLAFAPDGRALASGSHDKNIIIWDVGTGQAKMKPLTGHAHFVRSVAFTPDNRLLVSGCYDGTIRCWDTRTGKPVGQTINTDSGVHSVAVSPDGMKIAAGCEDATIRMNDIATRTLLFQYTGHTHPVWSVAFSPDGQHIASGSKDHTVCLWDGATRHAIGKPLIGHTGAVRSVSFSPDSRYVASTSIDKTIRIWDAESGVMKGDPLVGHTEWIQDVAFMPNRTHVASGSDDGTIKIWNVHHLVPARHFSSFKSEQTPENEIEITSSTSLQDIVSHLSKRGCTDMSGDLDWGTCETHPTSSGGLGDIFRGKLTSGQDVAIKTIRLYVGESEQSQKSLKRAAREVYTWSKCRHPNVQPLRGLVVFRNQIGMIMTWEPNRSVSQYIERHPEADRCAMSTQVSDGLAYLHASGVVHGDLKGANVLVSKDGRAQLADFGNAVLQDYTLQFSKTTTSTNYLFRWAAPELFQGSKCSIQADVYALGMTILEIIIGDVPWAGKGDHVIIFAVVVNKTHPERPMMHIPTNSKDGDKLWLLLQSCWLFEPEKRTSAAEVAEKMKNITDKGLKIV